MSSAKHRCVMCNFLHQGWYAIRLLLVASSKSWVKTSMARTKRYGNRGSPCFSPFAPLKYHIRKLLNSTENHGPVMHELIHRMKTWGKPKTTRIFVRKTQPTESKAFRKSTLMTHCRETLNLWQLCTSSCARRMLSKIPPSLIKAY